MSKRSDEMAESAWDEAKALMDTFCANPAMFNAGRRTCSKGAGAMLISHGITFACGSAYYARTRPLGCGVYQVWYEESDAK